METPLSTDMEEQQRLANEVYDIIQREQDGIAVVHNANMLNCIHMSGRSSTCN